MKFTSRREEYGAGEEGTKKLVKKYKKDTPGQEVKEVYADSGLGKWFGKGGKGGTTKGGWDRYNTKGEKIGKCGDRTAKEGKPKCLSAAKAAKMSKKEIANAVRRKRKADPSTDRPGTGNKPINVSNRIGEEVLDECWDTHVQKGYKMKGGKRVPNCVPRNEETTMKSFKSYISEAKDEDFLNKMNPEPTAKEMDAALKDKDYDKKLDAIRAKKKKKNESVEESEKKKPYIDPTKVKFRIPDRRTKIKLRDTGKKPATKPYPKLAGESVELDEKSPAWQRKEGKNKEGGLNAAGRRSYERENPGSDLKAPVSAAQAKRSKGGKAAKRRKSFCARMGGMPGPMKDEKGRPTRKALALRKWDC